jgi:hypothetical protein
VWVAFAPAIATRWRFTVPLAPKQARLASRTARNSKSEARNPKQIQNPKFQTCALENEYLPGHQSLEFWILIFGNYSAEWRKVLNEETRKPGESSATNSWASCLPHLYPFEPD